MYDYPCLLVAQHFLWQNIIDDVYVFFTFTMSLPMSMGDVVSPYRFV